MGSSASAGQQWVWVQPASQPAMPPNPFLFLLLLVYQASALPCPSPDSPCAASAAACPSGELANSTICAFCQECAREEGGACEWSSETKGAGQCASGLECRGEECIVDQTALPGCCSQPGACKGFQVLNTQATGCSGKMSQ